jgi:hypothetical protein
MAEAPPLVKEYQLSELSEDEAIQKALEFMAV